VAETRFPVLPIHTAGVDLSAQIRRRFRHDDHAPGTTQEILSPSDSSARPGASASTAFSSSAKGPPAISRTITDKAADARTKQTISGATPEWIPDSGRATHELA